MRELATLPQLPFSRAFNINERFTSRWCRHPGRRDPGGPFSRTDRSHNCLAFLVRRAR
jgi:hypothetical protein